MKKVLSLVLSVCIVIGIVSSFNNLYVFAVESHESESNDTYTTADELSINSSITGTIDYGTFSNDSDIDYYKFKLPQAGVVDIKFAHVVDQSSVGSWQVSVYQIADYDYNLLTSEQISLKDNSYSLPSLGLEAGEYYICVSNMQYTSGYEYKLSNSFTAATNWETEFNNSYATADTLKLNDSVYGCMMEGTFSNSENADSDYYRIDVQNKGFLNISFVHTSAPTGEYQYWDVDVYQKNGYDYIQLDTAHISSKDNTFHFTKIEVDKGTYYVVVKISQYAKGIHYQLSNTFECDHQYELIGQQSATCTADGYTSYRCTVCGAVKTDTLSATGHKWDNGKVTKKATPTATGIKTYTCTVCKKTKTKKIAKCAKYANPLTVKAKKPTIKFAKLKKKNQTVARKNAITVSKAKGTVTYTKVSGNKKITVNKKTGKITVKKGLKKGTYKVKIKVTAAGNDTYKKASKTVTVTIKVK